MYCNTYESLSAIPGVLYRNALAGICILLSYSVNLIVSLIGSSTTVSLKGTSPLLGISPKYASTSFFVFSISISPATTKTALLGLFHLLLKSMNSCSVAASRSSILPITDLPYGCFGYK